MCDDRTKKTTVTSSKQFFEQLEAAYPSATSTSKALLTSAEFGLLLKCAVNNDLESFIRETVRDELLEQGYELDDLDGSG